MTKREEYEQRAEQLIMPVIRSNGFELVDMEYVKEAGTWFLRVYIDKEAGVSIDDCEAVSRMLSDRLDETDFIDEAYILEVSSPGLGRLLKKDRHLEKSLLKEVDVKTFKPVEGAKEFTGILKAFDADTVTLETGDDGETRDIVFNRKEIAAIRLTLDF